MIKNCRLLVDHYYIFSKMKKWAKKLQFERAAVMKIINAELNFQVRHVYNDPTAGGQHNHPCYELVYYINGTGEVTINNRKHFYSPGTFSLILPTQNHFEVSKTPTEVLYIGFEMSDEIISLTEGVFFDADKIILSRLLNIEEEMQNKKRYFVYNMNLLTEEIIIQIGRMQNSGKEENYEKILVYIVNYIKVNCTNGINVENLASIAGYSYDYFRHIFKKQFGVSAKDYILREKIEKVKELLVNTNYTIKKISKMCSFSSPAHLIMEFKKLEKMTPTYYRDTYHNRHPYQDEIANY